MTAWEYRNGPTDEEGLGEMGAEGWELVTVVCPRPIQAPAEFVGIYKRPVTPVGEPIKRRRLPVRRKGKA